MQKCLKAATALVVREKLQKGKQQLTLIVYKACTFNGLEMSWTNITKFY